jgi:hypothetical protein
MASEKKPNFAKFVAKEAMAYALNAALLPFGKNAKGRQNGNGNGTHVGRPSTSPHHTPVLLVHGHGGGAGPWARLQDALAGAGLATTEAWTYRSTGPIPRLAQDLATYARHSLGGILARGGLQELGGVEQAKSLTTLSTPHRGIAKLPGAGLLPIVKEMLPGSTTLRRLETTVDALTNVPCLSVVSTRDHFVRPWGSAAFGRARLVPIEEAGHVGLLFSSEVHRLVADHVRDTVS